MHFQETRLIPQQECHQPPKNMENLKSKHGPRNSFAESVGRCNMAGNLKILPEVRVRQQNPGS